MPLWQNGTKNGMIKVSIDKARALMLNKTTHVYHVNPVKCFLFLPETVEPFQFSPVELVD